MSRLGGIRHPSPSWERGPQTFLAYHTGQAGDTPSVASRTSLLQGQFTTFETHDPSNVVEDIARLNNLIWTRFAQVVNYRQKIPSVIELIMNVLSERGR